MTRTNAIDDKMATFARISDRQGVERGHPTAAVWFFKQSGERRIGWQRKFLDDAQSQRQPHSAGKRRARSAIEPPPSAVEHQATILHQQHSVERLEAEVEIVADDHHALALRR